MILFRQHSGAARTVASLDTLAPVVLRHLVVDFMVSKIDGDAFVAARFALRENLFMRSDFLLLR